MSLPNSTRLLRVLAIAAIGLGLSACQQGREAFAITGTNTLITFETDDAGDIKNEVSISGLDAGETVVQIDIRPADTLLYGLTSSNRICTIDAATGAATLIATAPFAPAGTLNSQVMDINAVDDYLRIIAVQTDGTGYNVRVSPATGQVLLADPPLAYDTDDANDGEQPVLAAIAHTNSRTDATITTLYGLDVTTQSLVRITTGGTLTTIGVLDQGFVQQAGFDIVPNDGDNTNDEIGVAFVALAERDDNAKVYDLGLTDGNTSMEDNIGGDRQIRSLAVSLDEPEPDGFNF